MNRDKMYFIKKNKYLYELFDEKFPKQLSKELFIDEDLLQRLYDDEYKCELVNKDQALKICNYIKFNFNEVWEEADLRTKASADKPFVVVSDEIIKGLENNLIYKLELLGASNKKIDEFMLIVDDIVNESIAFAVETYKKGEVEQIKKFASKVIKK